MINNNKRDSNIELLRILAMFMIVAYHSVTNTIMNDINLLRLGTIINKITISFLYPCGRIGVMLFFMITGYFLAYKKQRNCNIVIIKTSLYSFITIVLFLFLYYVIHIKLMFYGNKITLLQFFLPISSGVFWFPTSYIFLIFLLPTINQFLEQLTKIKFLIFLFCFGFVSYGLGKILNVSYIRIYEAVFYYSCGVFYRFFKNEQRHKILNLLAFIVFYGFSVCLSYLYIDFLINDVRFKSIIPLIMNSLIVPLTCFPIFSLFLSLSIGQNSVINRIAASTFSVYLLHGSIFQRAIWEQIFNIKEKYLVTVFPLIILEASILVFVVSVLIDFLLDIIVFNKITDRINNLKIQKNNSNSEDNQINNE